MSKKLIAKQSSYDSEDEDDFCTLKELGDRQKKIERHTEKRLETIEGRLFELQSELMTILKDMVSIISEEAKKNEAKRKDEILDSEIVDKTINRIEIKTD